MTGLIVNEKLNVKRKYIRQIRAILHAWEKYGLENTSRKFWEKYPKYKFNEQQSSERFKQVVRSRINFIGSIKGRNDTVYIKLLRWLKRIDYDLVKDSELELAEKIETIEKECLSKPSVSIWTEGKTDVKHLKVALEVLTESDGKYYSFDPFFKDDLDDKRQGSSELQKMCEQFSKEEQQRPIIAIFDRDEIRLIPKIHDESRGFKEWGNGVYSFALPIPSHRQNCADDICIELYFSDEELKTRDKDGRRLFLSDEFHPKSRKHQDDPTINTTQNIKLGQIKIIDDSVFDAQDKNIALSKNKFSEYVLCKTEGFNNFSFREFSLIFEVVEKILKHHTELKKIIPISYD